MTSFISQKFNVIKFLIGYKQTSCRFLSLVAIDIYFNIGMQVLPGGGKKRNVLIMSSGQMVFY